MEEAVNILLERYIENQSKALLELVNISKSSDKRFTADEVMKNLRNRRENLK